MVCCRSRLFGVINILFLVSAQSRVKLARPIPKQSLLYDQFAFVPLLARFPTPRLLLRPQNTPCI